ncbi:hypothetical protein EVAR_82606_1 [Eumeta japonica]|uniref:Uncharacterized protein n=1 Tax=Eumeta variegata TaxID=151549 RepID=A0A4C1X6G4_EUMVA|nr:hypothetical protein EVAR_82606_1 [Eumeta japonica]
MAYFLAGSGGPLQPRGPGLQPNQPIGRSGPAKINSRVLQPKDATFKKFILEMKPESAIMTLRAIKSHWSDILEERRIPRNSRNTNCYIKYTEWLLSSVLTRTEAEGWSPAPSRFRKMSVSGRVGRCPRGAGARPQ